jgi:hypothetical protein
MPNYCNNYIELAHEDPEMINRACAAMARDEFLNEFIPVPEDLKIVSGRVGADDDENQRALVAQQESNLAKHGYKDWYDWCVNEWGTKWDTGTQGYEVKPESDGRMCIGFDTAWTPPIQAMEKLCDLGFSVRLMYYEPGMGFCGIWEDSDDDYYDISGMSSQQVIDDVPEELDECFGISDCIANYEEDESEELTEWYQDGVEKTGVTPHE